MASPFAPENLWDGSSVLITGATGSFGQAFTRYLLENHHPRRVVVFSRDELKQFEMAQALRPYEEVLRFFLGDVRDLPRLREALRDVDYVVHAAALKQVPAAEYNPMECVKTNIGGAENVVAAAFAAGVKKVVALSTDKAANPINLYGATKLVSDKIFVSANNIAGTRPTRFSVVRYGNVLGSRGSVLPFFRKLLAEGATELPITDERMTRFWITLSQGVEFVAKAFQRMQGGEIYVPKIPSTTVVDLARTLSPDCTLKMVGIRPGEKVHEVMCPSDSSHLTLDFPDHYVIQPAASYSGQVAYECNALGERGQPVAPDFEYASHTNPDLLSQRQVRELLVRLGDLAP